MQTKEDLGMEIKAGNNGSGNENMRLGGTCIEKAILLSYFFLKKKDVKERKKESVFLEKPLTDT